MIILEIIATVLVLVGVYLIAIPNIKGQYLLFIAQVLWCIFSAINMHIFLCIQSFVLLILNLYAIRNWLKKGVGYEAKQN